MCTSCRVTIDPAASDAFGDRMLEIVNHAGIALMASIGHRTGLFDAMAGRAPAGAGSIAASAGLNERYVREWLGAMVSAGIVEYDAGERTYALPDVHASWLTRAGAGGNVAATLQWIAVLGSVEDRVVECFRAGGGVPYEAYARFHEVMAEESAQTTVSALFDAIIPLEPGLSSALERGIDVLDVGCGRGRALIALAEAYPESRFVGLDFSAEAIESARAEAGRRRLRNLRFHRADLAAMEDVACFDLVTAFDAIHDQARPARVLAAIRRALRPGGVFLMQDIAGSSDVEQNRGRPLAPFIYTISCMHCMTVSLSQGGAGLGAAWGEELAQRMLADAGFRRIRMERLDHDILNAYYVACP